MAAFNLYSMTMIIMISTMTGSSEQVIQCRRDGDCPLGGVCFKDECARCLCEEGRRVINFHDGKTLQKICESKSNRKLQVGATCNDVSRGCPRGSSCISGVCTCSRSLVPHADLSHCRRPVFGERCTRTRPCASGQGLRCGRQNNTCRCKPSHRRPSPWTRMVLRRWDYSRVSGTTQSCIARAVGEPCRLDAHCAGVKGSGAICGDCGVCRCKVVDHVPDVLGTRCGEPLSPGRPCFPQSGKVCNGYDGLQCGSACELYVTDPRRKYCACSQMHDRRSGKCVQKTINSGCRTDLDCYPVREGFGYCEQGRCRAAPSSPHYQPYLVERECRNLTSTAAPHSDQLRTTLTSVAQYDVTSEEVSPPSTTTTALTTFHVTTSKATSTQNVQQTSNIANVSVKQAPPNASIICVGSNENMIYVIETRFRSTAVSRMNHVVMTGVAIMSLVLIHM